MPNKLDWNELKVLSLNPGGFGKQRVTLWPRLLHVKNSSESNSPSLVTDDRGDSHVPSNSAPQSSTHPDEHQIKLDTDRSFVLYPVGESKDREKLQTELHNLIMAVFQRRPRLSYYQGYHDIISVLFLTLPPALQLPCAEKLSLHRLRDSMGATLEPVVGLLRILKRLLQLADPSFAALLERNAPLPYYALSNLLTLFSHDVPTLPLIQHIFDFLLCRPPILVVYLAAAVVLSRKEEAEKLEMEGEEGMVHSLLSGLPDLFDNEETLIVKEEPFQLENVIREKIETSVPKTVNADEEREETMKEGEVQIPTTSPEETDELPRISGIQSFVNDLKEETKVLDIPAVPELLPLDASSESIPTNSDDQPPIEDAQQRDFDLASDIPAKCESPEPSLTIDTPKSEELDEKIPPSPSTPPTPIPRRLRIALSTLLVRADELYSLYPPSHPSIALPTIMGPQSTMLTWSAHAHELPNDDEAELMVLRPELVVRPYIETTADSEIESGDEGLHQHRRSKSKGGRERRRLKKPKRMDSLMHKKTMVAGAVIVLGVAVAVYGIRASPHGLTKDGHHALGREMRRVGRLVGGVINTGHNVIEGLWH